jgi:hypothetical protein
MTTAATKPCDDFPEPKDPVSLSSGSTSSEYADDDSTTDYDYDGTETTDDGVTDADGDGFDDDLYNPGTGDQDVPEVGDRGNGGGGPGGGGGGNGADAGGITP